MSASLSPFDTTSKSSIRRRYSALKKQIYLLEKAPTRHSAANGDLEANEHTALMSGESPTDSVFRHLLDLELKKVCEFYMGQERKILDELTELEHLVKMKDEESFSGADHRYMSTGGDFDDDDDDDDDETGMRGHSRSRERPSNRGGSLGRRRTKSDARPYGPARTYVNHYDNCKSHLMKNHQLPFRKLKVFSLIRGLLSTDGIASLPVRTTLTWKRASPLLARSLKTGSYRRPAASEGQRARPRRQVERQSQISSIL